MESQMKRIFALGAIGLMASVAFAAPASANTGHARPSRSTCAKAHPVPVHVKKVRVCACKGSSHANVHTNTHTNVHVNVHSTVHVSVRTNTHLTSTKTVYVVRTVRVSVPSTVRLRTVSVTRTAPTPTPGYQAPPLVPNTTVTPQVFTTPTGGIGAGDGSTSAIDSVPGVGVFAGAAILLLLVMAGSGVFLARRFRR